VAVAARYLQNKLGVKKVCIFDWDIHCGDGTQDIFYEDDTVLYVSMHRYDDNSFYPGDHKASPKLFGKGKGYGYNWSFGYNTPDTKVGDLDYIYACHNFLFPKIAAFEPEVILISSGFDSALNDPLGGISLTPIGYAWMTHGLVKICPKVITVLEGGYHLENLSKCSEAVLLALHLHPDDDKGFSNMLT
jgi:histone deacetylase 6